MSNSNFNITKVTVDPTSQEITGLEVNGKAFESGGPSDEYETWYVGGGYDAQGRHVPIAINGNPYDEHPDITHYVIPYNPDDEGNEMNWKKFVAYDVEVNEDTCGGMQLSFYLDEEKEHSVTMYTDEQEGAMSKIYIKSSDIA